MKRINERRMTSNFLNQLNENNYASLQGSSHQDLDPDGDGIVTQEDLYNHFDLNGDGKVTTDEYIDHIDFHCKHPESLEHYKKLRSSSIETVNCRDSYDACSKHLMSAPDGIEDIAYSITNGSSNDINQHLEPLMDQSGATCQNSSITALLDVFQSLINSGILN